MKTTFLTLLVGFLVSCRPSSSLEIEKETRVAAIEIPEIFYDLQEVVFNRSNSRWILKADSSEISGYVRSFYPHGSVQKSISIFSGKKEGIQETFFSNGELKFLESYRDNKLDGEVKRWTRENGYKLSAYLNYEDGRLHGQQKKWYSTGEIHKVMNLNFGREEGLQRAYRKNGALYANYEAKGGRIYGMMRSNLCYELENEEVVFYQ